MTPLIQCKNIDFSVGGPLLLEKATFNVHDGDRIGLVGRNGAGKSTLLKLLYGIHQADDGELTLQKGLRMGRLIQEVPHDIKGNVASVIAGGHEQHGELLAQYFIEEIHIDGLSDDVQNAMTEHELWGDVSTTKTLVSKFELNPNDDFAALSGGMKRRVLLARTLLNAPQILLLDEPTNHLDISTIQWLEEFLSKTRITLIIVSHDRAFLNKLCTSILEIDRGQVVLWNGNYDKYVEDKALALIEEERHQAKFDKKLAEEEAWIRQGIKARRTRNEGRVRALKSLRKERSQRREQQGKATFQIQDQNSSGKRVIRAKNISHKFGERTIINDFSTSIVKGDKIGIVGDNGCGKSTLVKILTERLIPDSGSLKMGTNIDIAYLDQMRSDINPNLSVLDNIANGKEFIEIDGRDIHAITYAQNFLFSPAKARGPVTALSGGERNRLLLAKLFTQPCNLLVLDEPTNDLDMETLELLESLLVEFQGTLILVSHDREFLNNVVSSTIVFENKSEAGTCEINEYIGGYDDWVWQSKSNNNSSEQNNAKEIRKPENDASIVKAKESAAAAPAKKKLSYKEQRPEKIETLETNIAAAVNAMNDPAFYQQDEASITKANQEMKEWQDELELCYSRWELLE